MGVGKRIGQILKDQGRTAAWLAREIGIPPTTLRSMISNDSKVDALLINKIAAVLGCSVRDLIPTGENNGIVTFETGEDFDAYNQSLADDIYMSELRVPALKLNDTGRKILLDNAESMTKNEDLTK